MKPFLTALTVLTFCGTLAAHEHKAPHGGCLIEIGEEFAHVELLLDAASGKLTAYILDGEAEKAVRIRQKELKLTFEKVEGKASELKVELKSVANVLTGEAEGDSSQFEGASDALKGVKLFHAAIDKIEIRGQKAKDIAFAYPAGNEDAEHKPSK
jgi:hypothetical protein